MGGMGGMGGATRPSSRSWSGSRRLAHAARPARSRRTAQVTVITANTAKATTNSPKTTSNATATAGIGGIPMGGGTSGTGTIHQATGSRAIRGVTPFVQTPSMTEPPRRPPHRSPAADRPVPSGPSAQPEPSPGVRPVLERLRGNPSRRPPADSSLAGGLREWLEDGVGAVAGKLPPDAPPMRIDRWTMSGFPPFDPRAPLTAPWARRELLASLFRQLVVTGRIDDPFADAVEALAADERGARVLDGLHLLPAAERDAVRQAVAAGALTMGSHWGAVPQAWRPRTQDRIRIPLAGGRVVLATTIDLVLGTPPAAQRSVCTVDLSTGAGPPCDRRGRHFTGLLETLRSGAPPFRVATYHPTSGELHADDLADDHLTASVQQVIDAVATHCGLEQEWASAA